MLFSTHRLISNKIHKAIENNLSINIDKKGFIYGNVKPDLDLNLLIKSHRISMSLKFVLKLVDKIINNKYTTLKQFSIDLGVINHFISDFFCYVHNEEISGNMSLLQHIIYEVQLHRKFKALEQNINLNLSTKDIRVIRKYNPIEMILKLQEDYYKAKKHIVNDIEYSLKASFVITLYIIDNAVFFNEERKIA